MTRRSLNRCEKCTCVQTSCTTQVARLDNINVSNLVTLIYLKRLLPLSSDLKQQQQSPCRVLMLYAVTVFKSLRLIDNP